MKLVRDGELIAVLHQYPDSAEKALSRIKAEWDLPQSDLDPKTIYQHLLRVAPEGDVVTEAGDPKEAQRLAQTTYEATFYDHYMAHAPIETHTALAKPKETDDCPGIHTATFGAKEEIAQALFMGRGRCASSRPSWAAASAVRANMQAVETVLVENNDVPPQGGGEPPIVVVAALIGNAIFDATGARLYELPMTPERVREAMTRAEKRRS